MKKLFVVAALVMGVGTTVSFAAETTENSVMATVTAVNEYTPIEVKDLPQDVQAVLAKDYSDFTVVSAAVQANEDGTNTYKVTVVDQEGVQSEVFFSEKGEILQ